MTPATALFGSIGWVALALGAALLEGERERRLAAAGLLIVGLSWAALRVTALPPAGPSPIAGEDSLAFATVNGGLWLVGLGLLFGAAAGRHAGRYRPGAALVTAIGAGLTAPAGGGLFLPGGPWRVIATALAVGGVGAALVFAGRKVRRGRRAADSRAGIDLLHSVVAGWPHGRVLLGVLILGHIAAGFGPHVAVVFGGVTAANWSAFLLCHPSATRPVPLAPAIALLLLPLYWLLATIAGPVGLSLESLLRVPLSPAAESIVAPILLLVAWSTAGLWPLHRQLPGALAGVAGALLLIRVALPLVPSGLDYFRPLAVPLLVLGVWHAATAERWSQVAVGAGLLGIAAVAAPGSDGAGWLLGSAFALALTRALPLRPALGHAVNPALWVAGSWGGLLVLQAGLKAEVVYTALGALGLALLLLTGAGRHASGPVSGAGAR